ncbi:hypothetical protein ACF08N_24350 [Streptomyces sp. NPDC015127]|uniref:hypothetical protein n=1 Tax=Streptomyces sp. NPDC015127 TaxID=3364939 RepID=UPI0036F87552
MAAWGDFLEEARQDLGFTGQVVPRTVEGVRAALLPGRLPEFGAELGTLSEGVEFEAFLNHWWTQAMADSVQDEEGKESAIEFADLAVALRARAAGGPEYSHDDVEKMLKDVAS